MSPTSLLVVALLFTVCAGVAVAWWLVAFRRLHPPTLVLDAQAVRFTRGREQVVVPLADVEWALVMHSTRSVVFGGRSLGWTAGAVAPGQPLGFVVPLDDFTPEEAEAILGALDVAVRTAGGVMTDQPPPIAPRPPEWTGPQDGQTWVGRSGWWARLFVGAMSGGCVVFFVGEAVYFGFLTDGPHLPVWALVLLVVMAASMGALGAWGLSTMRMSTLTVDAYGLRLVRGRFDATAAFTDITSITYYQASRSGMPYIQIVPRAEYLQRAGKRWGLGTLQRWSLNSVLFSTRQMLAFLPFLEIGIERAGGRFEVTPGRSALPDLKRAFAGPGRTPGR